MEQILFKHNRPDRVITCDEYPAEGSFSSLRTTLAGMFPAEVQQTPAPAPWDRWTGCCGISRMN